MTIRIRIPLSFDKLWLSYFLIKILYMFFALFVYSKFTILGDTHRYLSGQEAWASNWLLNSTIFMDTIAGTLSSLFGPVLANVPFAILAFIGVYYPVKRMNLDKSSLLILLTLLSFPSFGVWTSIASKEAITVFFLGIILGAMIEYVGRKRISHKFILMIAIYLCLLFKPQYMAGVGAGFLYIFFSRNVFTKATDKLTLFLIYVACSVLVLFFLRDVLDNYSRILPAHFNPEGGSTRENTFWIDQYDIFWSAAYGMYIAFVGPTFAEAMAKPTHLMVWLESMIIVGAFMFCILHCLFAALHSKKLNIYLIGIFCTVSFWILFAHYPFGLFNPGSAVRYRSGFYAFLVILFFYCYRQAYLPYRSFEVSRSPNRPG